MEPEPHLAFGPFHFDGTQGRLWRSEQAIALRPQSLALLRYLVAHPGRLVTKAEVRQHVWAGTHVTDTVLRVSVHEIRQALGDVAAAPRYLATVGGQGYRFLLGAAVEGPPPLTPGPRVGRRGDLEAVDVQQPVVRLCGGVDLQPAAVVAAIADRDLHGAHRLDLAVMLDVHRERPPFREQLGADHAVAEHAPALLGLAGEPLRQPRREADARHVEVEVAVHLADVDVAGVARDDHARVRT